MNFIYYMSLLFILFFILFLIDKDRSKAPKKIRIFLGVSLAVLFIRNMSLLLMCVIKNVEIIYLLKNLIYLDYLIIPIIILTLYYINFRFDNINFNINYIVSVVLCLVYVVFICNIDGSITLSASFGYFIILSYGNIIKGVVLAIIGVILLVGALLIDKPNSNKRGIFIIILVLISMVIEHVLIILGLWVFPYCIISEMLLLLAVNNSLNSFK